MEPVEGADTLGNHFENVGEMWKKELGSGEQRWYQGSGFFRLCVACGAAFVLCMFFTLHSRILEQYRTNSERHAWRLRAHFRDRRARLPGVCAFAATS